MADRKNDINSFTAADVRRYVEGRMGDDEKHRLERAALDDPFLADAIEGMRASIDKFGAQNFESDVSELKRRVHGLSDRRPARIWWKVAALIAVVVTGIALTFLMQKNNQPDATLAQNERSSASLQYDTISLTTIDSGRTTVEETTGEQKDDANRKGRLSIKQQATSKNEEQALSKNEEQSISKNEEQSISKNKRRATGPVQQEDNAIVTTESPAKTETRPADKEDSAEGRDVQGFGMVRKKELSAAEVEAAQSDSADKIVGAATVDNALQGRAAGVKIHNGRNTPEDAELFEVVVTGFSPIRNAEKRIRQNTSSKRFAPEKGWPAFHQYVQQNRRIQADDDSNEFEELSFSIDSSGRPADIRIIRSISKEHDAEAIRLLDDGPAWKIVKGKPRRLLLRIQF